jgi:hypothetical protein
MAPATAPAMARAMAPESRRLAEEYEYASLGSYSRRSSAEAVARLTIRPAYRLLVVLSPSWEEKTRAAQSFQRSMSTQGSHD